MVNKVEYIKRLHVCVQSCEAQLAAFDACSSVVGRDSTASARLTAAYHAAHNDYVLQLSAANASHRHYHHSVLPATLKVSLCVRRTFPISDIQIQML